jgi:hypothetical protein
MQPRSSDPSGESMESEFRGRGCFEFVLGYWIGNELTVCIGCRVVSVSQTAAHLMK